MSSPTPNGYFNNPTVGGDTSVWGTILNANFTTQDSVNNLRTQNLNFADYQAIRPTIKDYAEVVQDVTSGTTTTINIEDGNIVNLSQGTDITTLTITNPSATGKACSLTIIRTKDNSGTSRSITWPASVKWPSGSAPSLTQTANAIDIITMFTINAGTTWFAFTSGTNMS